MLYNELYHAYNNSIGVDTQRDIKNIFGKSFIVVVVENSLTFNKSYFIY